MAYCSVSYELYFYEFIQTKYIILYIFFPKNPPQYQLFPRQLNGRRQHSKSSRSDVLDSEQPNPL